MRIQEKRRFVLMLILLVVITICMDWRSQRATAELNCHIAMLESENQALHDTIDRLVIEINELSGATEFVHQVTSGE